jgi:hypothetical protein
MFNINLNSTFLVNASQYYGIEKLGLKFISQNYDYII